MDFDKYIKARKAENEFKANYDLSAAASVEINGKKGYMGAKPKEKRSFWQRLKDITKFDLKNTKEVLKGEKSLLQAVKDRNAVAHQDMMENNKAYRDAVSTLQGVKDAFKDKIDEKVASNEVLTRLRDNIKEGIKDTAMSNELHHKFDVSKSGVREKPSFWKRLKNVLTGKKSVYAAVRDNVKDVRKADAAVYGTAVGVRKTLHELRVSKPGQYRSEALQNTQRENPTQARIVAMRAGNANAAVYRQTEPAAIERPQERQVQVNSDLYNALETYSRINAMEQMSGISGFSYNGKDKNSSLDVLKQASPAELKLAIGQFKANTEKNPAGNADFSAKVIDAAEKLPEQLAAKSGEKNKYAELDDGQFRVAMGVAYENLYRLNGHNNPGSYAADKKEVITEIQQVLDEAKRRFPNVADVLEIGSLYKDADVAKMEQQMMPFMREAAKQDKVFAGDVNRFEAWRDGKNATIMNGSMTVVEQPYANKARWPSSMVSTDQLRHPFEAGKKVMSQKEFMQAKAKIESLHLK